ncbi:glycosyltransferase family 4 protein [Halomonas campisalis]|uniref:Glycosyltransferase family 4 protein n=1 Tax=Billgrantia campisalis TaxID=74661 RepID=A0ABS9P8C4_9GAMM|nr:glycosyltransferase family 4 protein [Halomonas campisalis]MCG6658025.1 glycosyltransferase family 4 protein [Halomonas campisalis]MDR5862692.1 glycosyltransferase family 4 protein [Halomonas campisalis]
MRLLVTANHTPFIAGGADYHVNGLVDALRQHGHQAELLRLPFHYGEAEIERLMAFTEGLDLRRVNDVDIDRVISLQFPGYGVNHPDHVVWLMHQHRACYELYDPNNASPALAALKPKVEAYDRHHLAKASRRYANSPRVAERLREYNGLAAQPLYHPPHRPERFTCAADWGYIFYPSRLEPLKRQALLIEAAAHLTTPVKLLIAGDGSQRHTLEAMIETLGVEDRVRLLGRISEAEKLTLYAHALAVAFPPFDEDYGYVTLEAMLSAKPVISCTDSGGPTAFIEPGESGWITSPTPEALAAACDAAWQDRRRTAEMGQAARAVYAGLDIGWEAVIETLLSS